MRLRSFLVFRSLNILRIESPHLLNILMVLGITKTACI